MLSEKQLEAFEDWKYIVTDTQLLEIILQHVNPNSVDEVLMQYYEDHVVKEGKK